MSLYNLRNPAVKRLMKEAEELSCSTNEYHAQPLEDNLFEWHFTLSGPPNTEFEGGIYHGRITLPPDYPMKPPSIILLTPNGRFETNKKICLSISGYHPESWQPSWSIRTALLAIIGFLPTHGNGAIGSLDYTPEERKDLALKSQEWKCPQCGIIRQYLTGKEAKSSSESPEIPAPAVQAESISESENTSSSADCNMLSNDNENINFIKQEEQQTVQSNILNIPKENSATAVKSPSTSRIEETILRHRRIISQQQSGQTNVSNATRPACGNWSLGAIWVIVILLAILILRRIIC